MCSKAGQDELDTIANLMSMSLRAVIAGVLERELEAVTDAARLSDDLGMDAVRRTALQSAIADVFDGICINLHETPTVATLLDRVVAPGFRSTS